MPDDGNPLYTRDFQVETLMLRERLISSALLVLVLGGWLLFPVHQAPRFSGSFAGSLLGISAAVLVLSGLAYGVAKRVASMRRHAGLLLAVHVYASLVGAFVAVLHSAHRFDSALGIALMSAMLLAVASGYAGRHFLRYLGDTLRVRQTRLEALQRQYDALAEQSRSTAISAAPVAWGRFVGRVLGLRPSLPGRQDSAQLFRLVEAIADTEFAIREDERLRKRLNAWVVVHLGTAVALYLLLLVHVVAALRYGLRWMS